jgi:hypothetical protein
VYAKDVVFHSHPFRLHRHPREYAEWAFSGQRSAEARFGEPIVEGTRAAVDWWAVVESTDGTVETLAGASLLRFDAAGRVVEQRDAWAAAPGRVDIAAWAPES